MDLADCHAPVSDFLALSGDSWPVTDAARARYSLSEEQLARFAADGFMDEWQVLNEAQVERLREELSSIMDPRHALHHLWHDYNENEAGGVGQAPLPLAGGMAPRALVPRPSVSSCHSGARSAAAGRVAQAVARPNL